MRFNAVTCFASRLRPFVAAIVVSSCSDATAPISLRLESIAATNVSAIVAEELQPGPVVRVVDASNRPVAGVEVAFSPVNGGKVSHPKVRTNASGEATPGIWTLGVKAQTYVVHARVKGANHVEFTAIAKPAPAASMEIRSGDRQIAKAGERVPAPLQVTVRDRFGNPVGGALVMFAAVSGGGMIDAMPVETDTAGIATTSSWTLGPIGGEQELRATLKSVEHVTFHASACDAACQSFQLLFVNGGHLYRKGLGESASVVHFNVQYPAVSADGRRIAFNRFDDDGNAVLYVMNADGSNERRVRTNGFVPSWSPDGRTLAVANRLCWYDCSIVVLDVDGDSTGVMVASMAARPAWSPDGSKIAFVSLSGDDGYHAIYLMNPDGAEITAITVRDPGFIDGISWAPDGQRLAYSKCLSDGCDIYVVTADGSSNTRRTNIGNAVLPAWSPDGSHIAIVLRSGTDNTIGYITADGNGPAFLVTSSGSTPVWIPTSAVR